MKAARVPVQMEGSWGLFRKESQEDCAFIRNRDPHEFLIRRLGESFAHYRRLWDLATNFELETPYPLQLDFELNYSCNLKCPMCTWSLESSAGSSRDWFPAETYRQIVREGVSKGLKALNMCFINEPLMRKDLPDLIRFGRDAGVLDIGLSTNGTLLTAAVSRSLISSGLTRLQVSIDAHSSETFDRVRTGGDYSKVVANVRRFLGIRREMGLELPLVGVSFVKQNRNEAELDPFVRYWEKEVDYILIREYLVPVMPDSGHFGEKSGLFPEDRHLATAFRCSKPWQRMIVRHDGTLLPCCSFQGVYLPMGNVFRTPLQSVWQSAPMKALRDLHRRGEYLRNSVCKACALGNTVDESRLPAQRPA